MATPTFEICVGCGIRHQCHSVVAVMREEEAEAIGAVPISAPNQHGFVQVPVCAACHADPAHRVTPIKGHFFLREQAPFGHKAASQNLSGKSVGMGAA